MEFIFLIMIIILLIFYTRKKLKKIKNKLSVTTEEKTDYSETEAEEIIKAINISCEMSNTSSNEIEILSEFYGKIRPYTQRIDELINLYPNYFHPHKYTKEISEISEKYIELYYEEVKKIVPIARNYKRDNGKIIGSSYLDDYYIYNMAECYYTQDKFEKAQEVFEYGFDNLFEYQIYNLNKSYKNFVIYLIEKFKIDFAIKSMNIILKKYNFSDGFYEDISEKLSDYLDVKKVVLELTESIKKHEINEKIKFILNKAEILQKIYKNLDYAEANFKGKNYIKAKESFELAIESAEIYKENIDFEYELYGDIFYKLKEYRSAILAYLKSKDFNSYRIYSKIGDSYKMQKNIEKAFENYFYSLYYKADYKTSQAKLILAGNKLSKNIDIEKIIRMIKNNTEKTKEELLAYL